MYCYAYDTNRILLNITISLISSYKCTSDGIDRDEIFFDFF